MQPPQRYIPSVSDLYGTDEIEFLLDEIRDLEPACCQLEDIQVGIYFSLGIRVHRPIKNALKIDTGK